MFLFNLFLSLNEIFHFRRTNKFKATREYCYLEKTENNKNLYIFLHSDSRRCSFFQRKHLMSQSQKENINPKMKPWMNLNSNNIQIYHFLCKQTGLLSKFVCYFYKLHLKGNIRFKYGNCRRWKKECQKKGVYVDSFEWQSFEM